MKKFKMNLLNPCEMKKIYGGGTAPTCKRGTGETVLKICVGSSDLTVKYCETYELNCPSNFTIATCKSNDTGSCSGVTLTPKP
jgi:hypothetical protein